MANVIPLTNAGGTVTGCKMPNGDILPPPCDRFGRKAQRNPVATLLSGNGMAVSKFRGFVDSPDATPKNNLVFGGAAVIGALVARKMIKKGDKNLNTVIGGVAGLGLGLLITKFVK